MNAAGCLPHPLCALFGRLPTCRPPRCFACVSWHRSDCGTKRSLSALTRPVQGTGRLSGGAAWRGTRFDTRCALALSCAGYWTPQRRCSMEGLVTLLAAARPNDFNMLGGGSKGLKGWVRCVCADHAHAHALPAAIVPPQRLSLTVMQNSTMRRRVRQALSPKAVIPMCRPPHAGGAPPCPPCWAPPPTCATPRWGTAQSPRSSSPGAVPPAHLSPPRAPLRPFDNSAPVTQASTLAITTTRLGAPQ